MSFRLLACSAILASCFVPVLGAQTPIDATLPNGPQISISGGGGSMSYMALAPAPGAEDDFSGPAGTSMGPDWTEVAGDMWLNGVGQGYGTVKGHMIHATAMGDYAGSTQSIDFSSPGATLVYQALIAGYNATSGDYLFVKVQDNNSDGFYDRCFFYSNGSGGWGASPYYYDLAVPTMGGRMTLSFDSTGDVAKLEIDRDFDGIVDEGFKADKILSSGLVLGGGFGIAVYNNQNLYDNWELNGGAGVGTVVGTGFPGASGTPTLALDAPVAIGTTPNLLATSSALGAETCLLFFGTKQTSIPGFWGGDLYVVPLVTIVLPMPVSGWTLGLPVPKDPKIVGFQGLFQFIQSDKGAANGVSSSPGLLFTIEA